ncbi:MAG: thioether cross-link-forming SCIFF peptide maturase [Veillonellales bacterium]
MSEIKLLAEQGLLFTSNSYLEHIVQQKKADHSVKALCLHVAHDCNLRCEYCFAAKGDYHSGRKLMPLEVALAAVDFLVKNSGNKHTLEIDFFGGEPLMNFDTVKKVVAYGRNIEKKSEKHFYFTITTNGTLLNKENIDFINREMDNIVISLDGRKQIHDSIRCDRSGKGTYDKIVPLAQQLVQKRGDKSYFIRGTFTARNKDFSKDVLHLASLGFKEISIEPVVGLGEKLFITKQDLPEILHEYETFALEYSNVLQKKNPFRFYHFNLNLYNGPCIYKRITACGAGFEYLAVSPEGDLYPCHQFVGQKEFSLGNVNKGITNNILKNRFQNNNILTKEKCRDCWAKLFCSGGCHANSWYSNGTLDIPNDIACTLQKKRIECALMIQILPHMQKKS